MPSLSKSRYLSGDQCHLRLWYDSNERDLAPPPDDTLQAVFDTGHEVGELACERHPGGHSVGHDHRHVREALEETRQVIQAGAAPALFEAAFRHRGVLVRADIIERLPGGGWRLVEVKSTTRLKDVFVLDVAVQLWVLRGAGLDVREAEVITLNRDYVYDGVRLDLDALFKRHPLTAEAGALQHKVHARVGEMLAMLSGPAAPEIAPGDHCFAPYDCPYHAHCTRDCVSPDRGIADRPIEVVGSLGSICTYSGYERKVLTALAAAVPARAEELPAVSARLFDLLPVVRNTYYHPEFRGSFSIKHVLPVLVPGMGYGDLEIPDGQTASVHYMQALASNHRRESRHTFDDLRAYCERDTLAMVRLREALGAIA